MFGTTKSQTMTNSSIRRLVASALLLFFVLLPIIAVAFLVANADFCHEHHHVIIDDGCVACTQVLKAGSLLRQIGATVKSQSFLFISLFLASIAVVAELAFSALPTPVNLKVKITN